MTMTETLRPPVLYKNLSKKGVARSLPSLCMHIFGLFETLSAITLYSHVQHDSINKYVHAYLQYLHDALLFTLPCSALDSTAHSQQTSKVDGVIARSLAHGGSMTASWIPSIAEA
jgi:hypothetical protein